MWLPIERLFQGTNTYLLRYVRSYILLTMNVTLKFVSLLSLLSLSYSS